MEHSKHIWRVLFILLFLLVGFVSARDFLIPASFGKAGHYRYDSLKTYMDYPVIHGGRNSCKGCHPKQYETASAGKHASLNCEACHGPLAWHVKDGARIAEMPRLASWKLCAYCHQTLAARPSSIKQVVFAKHIEEQGSEPGTEVAGKVCFLCHKPHSPLAGSD
jgi:hypothetical protein